jgi:hypothetical protein
LKTSTMPDGMRNAAHPTPFPTKKSPAVERDSFSRARGAAQLVVASFTTLRLLRGQRRGGTAIQQSHTIANAAACRVRLLKHSS